jgi:RNA polymerase sigma-70 factor, ECF subfamily
MNMAPGNASIPEGASVSLDDQALISRCRAGDRGAFKELVQRYQRRIYGIAQGMLHSKEDAMDVTQEVFIRVHMYMSHFKGTSSFYTWLYRIAVNLCIDHLRKEGKLQTVDYDDSVAHDYGEDPGELLPKTLDMNPGSALDRKETSALINKALQTLSPNHRAVLLMREVEGLSYTEMAEIMQCNKGTIMSRLFNARKRMQDALVALMREKDLQAG